MHTFKNEGFDSFSVGIVRLNTEGSDTYHKMFDKLSLGTALRLVNVLNGGSVAIESLPSAQVLQACLVK